jgi:hypothetical protein
MAVTPHLDTELGKPAKELDLVFWNKLRERNEEASLETHQPVVVGPKPVRPSTQQGSQWLSKGSLFTGMFPDREERRLR